MDTQLVVVLHFITASFLGTLPAADSACDQAEAEACLSTFQNRIFTASSNADTLEDICRSSAAKEEALACVNAAARGRACAETRANYHSQLALLHDLLNKTCASPDSLDGGPQGCQATFVEDCAAGLYRAVGRNATSLADIYAMLIPPANHSSAAQQRRACNKLGGIDFDDIKTCITTRGCADGHAMPSLDDVSDIPKITYIDVLNIIKGICQPDCEGFSMIFEEAKQCIKDITGSDDCRQKEEQFSCVRQKIGSCKILSSFLKTNLASIIKDSQEKCPDADLSLEPGAANGYPSNAPMSGFLFCIVLATTLLNL